MSTTRILVAGVGNVLRGDDGFGPAVVNALEREGGLPPGVRTFEAGIGGLALLHEFMDGCDAAIIADAVDRGEAPGSVVVLEPRVPDPDRETAQRLPVMDMHRLVPERVLFTARALGVMPPVVRIVGCQAGRVEELETELTPAVAGAVPAAVDAIRALVARWMAQ